MCKSQVVGKPCILKKCKRKHIELPNPFILSEHFWTREAFIFVLRTLAPEINHENIEILYPPEEGSVFHIIEHNSEIINKLKQILNNYDDNYGHKEFNIPEIKYCETYRNMNSEEGKTSVSVGTRNGTNLIGVIVWFGASPNEKLLQLLIGLDKGLPMQKKTPDPFSCYEAFQRGFAYRKTRNQLWVDKLQYEYLKLFLNDFSIENLPYNEREETLFVESLPQAKTKKILFCLDKLCCERQNHDAIGFLDLYKLCFRYCLDKEGIQCTFHVGFHCVWVVGMKESVEKAFNVLHTLCLQEIEIQKDDRTRQVNIDLVDVITEGNTLKLRSYVSTALKEAKSVVVGARSKGDVEKKRIDLEDKVYEWLTIFGEVEFHKLQAEYSVTITLSMEKFIVVVGMAQGVQSATTYIKHLTKKLRFNHSLLVPRDVPKNILRELESSLKCFVDDDNKVFGKNPDDFFVKLYHIRLMLK